MRSKCNLIPLTRFAATLRPARGCCNGTMYQLGVVLISWEPEEAMQSEKVQSIPEIHPRKLDGTSVADATPSIVAALHTR